jgi:hypothetical protein
MSETPWALVLLLIFAAVIAGVVCLGLIWLVYSSHLAGWVKVLLDSFLGGFFVFGGTGTRKRIKRGKSPWSLDKPERG